MKKLTEYECYDLLYGWGMCWKVEHYQKHNWFAWRHFILIEKPIFDEVIRILTKKNILPKEER